MGHGSTYVQDLALGKKILEILEKNYSGHAWFVDTNHEAGHASVQLMYEGLDGKVRIWKYGFLLHINKIANLDMHALENRIKDVGGEILERYHLKRAKFSIEDMVNFKEHGIDPSNMVMESVRN